MRGNSGGKDWVNQPFERYLHVEYEIHKESRHNYSWIEKRFKKFTKVVHEMYEVDPYGLNSNRLHKQLF